nr:hypothetical protein [Tanacetum cinerariifolium]
MVYILLKTTDFTNLPSVLFFVWLNVGKFKGDVKLILQSLYMFDPLPPPSKLNAEVTAVSTTLKCEGGLIGCGMLGHLHSDSAVFQKYYDFCVENARTRYLAALKGIAAQVQGGTSNCVKHNLNPDAESDVFSRYFDLYTHNARPRCPPNLPQAVDCSIFGVSKSTDSDIFEKYSQK